MLVFMTAISLAGPGSLFMLLVTMGFPSADFPAVVVVVAVLAVFVESPEAVPLVSDAALVDSWEVVVVL
jgi:hypothetical protein